MDAARVKNADVKFNSLLSLWFRFDSFVFLFDAFAYGITSEPCVRACNVHAPEELQDDKMAF